MIKTRKGSASRRTVLKWSLAGLGFAVAAGIPKRLTAQMSSGVKTLTFNADDVGILNFALLLEELEAAFYAFVLKSGKITDPREVEYFTALGSHEAEHVRFLRSVLAENAIFATKDLSFNRPGLDAITRDHDTILKTAVSLEDTGVHAYNGAGPSLKNPTYILAAGSIVSVEARHAVGARALLQRPATEPDSDRAVPDAELVPELNPFKGRPYDELYTPKQIVAIVSSLNLLNNPITGALVA
ncbi:hypothetical protein AVDCRST_MAG81-4485 [uncultured Synechococcales cyanobacterium]|uniref:Dessication-associated protein n=1 Tax=uncultured Synechococcales cyanobacterium TaxID=1936017 RepID=A0A6J4VTF8_9CYAN|nr:hypothetical protein AVDCRST_MAG81-4485 [uncultured Synechococcales cyanobacterium]